MLKGLICGYKTGFSIRRVGFPVSSLGELLLVIYLVIIFYPFLCVGVLAVYFIWVEVLCCWRSSCSGVVFNLSSEMGVIGEKRRFESVE